MFRKACGSKRQMRLKTNDFDYNDENGFRSRSYPESGILLSLRNLLQILIFFLFELRVSFSTIPNHRGGAVV